MSSLKKRDESVLRDQQVFKEVKTKEEGNEGFVKEEGGVDLVLQPLLTTEL